MENTNHIYVKIVILLLILIVALYSVSVQTNHYGAKRAFKTVYETLNKSQILELFKSISPLLIGNRTIISNQTLNLSNTTNATKFPTTTMLTTAVVLTTTTNPITTIDPAELVVERPPPASRLNSKDSKSNLAVFLFQTQHHVLANLQLYLVRKFATDLVGLELFTDGPASNEMREVAAKHKAELHSFPSEKHSPNVGPSDRNTDVVNWAIANRAKRYLGNGTAILSLDGDVFPLTPFDSTTLLSSHDLICRKHPALFARYCWIGLICLSPRLYSTIDDYDVSQLHRGPRAYDSGGKTIEYLLKYPNTSFSWMKETILLKPDKDIFWGTFDGDIQWILQNFYRCDKCGPEIFFSPFNSSNAVFYHMISGTSEWRFGHQAPRRQAIHDAVMRSPYGPDKQYSQTDLIASVSKIQKMQLWPYHGNFTCESYCKG